ncbi:hypothetical protein V8C86DRAFT_1553423 [Haematococcus lacustris]
MANRNRAAAPGTFPPGGFEGRVREWKKVWTPLVQGSCSDEVRLEGLKWVPTGVTSKQPAGPRHPHLKPVAGTKPLNLPGQGQGLDSLAASLAPPSL